MSVAIEIVFICLVQPIEELEAEMLNGQKLQGPLTAKEVNETLNKSDGNISEWVCVYSVCACVTSNVYQYCLVTLLYYNHL